MSECVDCPACGDRERADTVNTVLETNLDEKSEILRDMENNNNWVDPSDISKLEENYLFVITH